MVFWKTNPTRKNPGRIIRRERYGSIPYNKANQKVAYMLNIKNSPWAKLIICMTPKIRVNPMEIRAYMPPTNIPLIIS
jgi:hypothetical protein